MSKKIGILGGSFNPVHTGHLMLASWIAQCGVVDSVWLMLSPLNPLKTDCSMASDHHRMRMLELAVKQSDL
ncbi:adenylyltransferase/cytidyltransferase family protein, partial [uncultured Muribaculum sp.]